MKLDCGGGTGLHEGHDDDPYLNTLEAEAKSWAERHFVDDAAQIARAARALAVEQRARREKEVAAGAAATPPRPQTDRAGR